MEPIMDNNFIRQVYYHSLIPIHEPVKYISIDFIVKNRDGHGNGSGDGYGNGHGNE